MRNPNLGRLISIIALALVACGPSATELKGAKTAHYKGDKLVMFNAAKAATAEKYKLAKSDEVSLGFQTEGRWYTPEGLAASERAGDMRDVPDRSINEILVVQLIPDGDAWVVSVKPVMLRYYAGRPNPDKLEENDPSVPGWATGKVDNLALEIHEALKAYEVKTVPGMLPPPTTTAPGAREEPKPEGATPPAPSPAK